MGQLTEKFRGFREESKSTIAGYQKREETYKSQLTKLQQLQTDPTYLRKKLKEARALKVSFAKGTKSGPRSILVRPKPDAASEVMSKAPIHFTGSKADLDLIYCTSRTTIYDGTIRLEAHVWLESPDRTGVPIVLIKTWQTIWYGTLLRRGFDPDLPEPMSYPSIQRRI